MVEKSFDAEGGFIMPEAWREEMLKLSTPEGWKEFLRQKAEYDAENRPPLHKRIIWYIKDLVWEIKFFFRIGLYLNVKNFMKRFWRRLGPRRRRVEQGSFEDLAKFMEEMMKEERDND